MEKVIKTVVANQTDKANRITEGKEYKVLRNCIDFYEIVNDDNNIAWVFKHRFESDLLSKAKQIADDAGALAERERIRDIVAERVRNSCLPGGDIFKSMRGEMTVGIQDRIVDKTVDSVIENARENHLSTGRGCRIHKAGMAICSNDYDPNEYVKVLEQLREVLRVPEGENIVTHAKVVRALADVLIGLQNDNRHCVG